MNARLNPEARRAVAAAFRGVLERRYSGVRFVENTKSGGVNDLDALDERKER